MLVHAHHCCPHADTRQFIFIISLADSTKYDPITQEIFANWIPVHDILRKKKDKALGKLFVNPPVLPWYVAKKPHIYCAFIMNFITLGSTSIYKNGGNNANYIQSNGQMTESCWQLPWQSMGDEIFLPSLLCDFWPFAYNHKNKHGKPEVFFVRMTSQISCPTSASLLRLWFAVP